MDSIFLNIFVSFFGKNIGNSNKSREKREFFFKKKERDKLEMIALKKNFDKKMFSLY